MERKKEGERERERERERGERGFLPFFFYLRINDLKMVLIYGKSRTFY